MSKGDIVTCELCGEPFLTARSDEEAKAEFEALKELHAAQTAEVDWEEQAIVCSPCYEKILPEMLASMGVPSA